MNLEILDNHVPSKVARGRHPLLFIHGAACSAGIWQRMLEWLAAEGVAATAVSLRGHGGSDGFDRLHEHGIMDYVEDVRRTASAMDREPVLVGHSMGGLVVQKLLESWDAPGAVLLATAPVGGMARDGLRMFARWPGHFAKALARRSFVEIYATDESLRWLLFSSSSDPALIGEARRELREESWRAILDIVVRVRPAPANVTTPVLVLAGAEDNMVSAASSERTARAYGAEIRFFDRCGHMMMMENTWPLVARAISEWEPR